MKVNRLESHDRLESVQKEQQINVFKGAEDCLKRNTLSLAIQEKCPYVYLFAHSRTTDDGNRALYWQPRISRPKAESNSYLFRAKSHSDEIEVCWIIPPEEFFEEYDKDKMMHNELINWSIKMFRKSREILEKSDPQDLTEGQGQRILQQIINEHRQSLRLKRGLSSGIPLILP